MHSLRQSVYAEQVDSAAWLFRVPTLVQGKYLNQPAFSYI